MKKVINGRRYDTSTAKELGWWLNERSDELGRREVTLYLKRNGEYFAEVSKSWWHGGDEIVPISEQEAIEWMKRITEEAIGNVLSGALTPTGYKLFSKIN